MGNEWSNAQVSLNIKGLKHQLAESDSGQTGAVVTYQYRPDLSFSLRGEHFSDPDGFILFPTSTARGNYNALTTGLRWDLTRSLVLRPEVRYDWFDPRDHDRPYGNGRDRSQLSTMVEALFYF